MKLPHIAIILATAAALAAPAPCAAQEPVTFFDQLDTRLKPGDTVWVTDAQGREIKGTIETLGPDALTLKGDGTDAFAARDVARVQRRERDSLVNGTLIGLGVGVGFAVAAYSKSTAEERENCRTEYLLCGFMMVVYAGLGAGIGAGIDALIPGKKAEVSYRAPDPAGGTAARLSIAPVVTRRAKGVAVAFAF